MGRSLLVDPMTKDKRIQVITVNANMRRALSDVLDSGTKIVGYFHM